MPIEVTMPKLSPTMESGVIAQWLVKVGDTIKEGDVLADIETDKATMQMKSYDDGIIVHIDHPAGDEVALGQRVMVLAKKGEDAKQVAAGLGLGGAQAAPAPKTAETEVKPAACRVGFHRGDDLGQWAARGRRAAGRGPRRPAQGQPARPQDGRVVST